METAFMVEKLLLYHPEETVRLTYLPLLGLPPSRPQLQRMRALVELESPWQELVAHSRLSPEAAAVLRQWPAADREAIWPWFQTLVLSYSKQLEILEYLNTLSRRTGEAPAAWLRRPELVGGAGRSEPVERGQREAAAGKTRGVVFTPDQPGPGAIPAHPQGTKAVPTSGHAPDRRPGF